MASIYENKKDKIGYQIVPWANSNMQTGDKDDKCVEGISERERSNRKPMAWMESEREISPNNYLSIRFMPQASKSSARSISAFSNCRRDRRSAARTKIAAAVKRNHWSSNCRFSPNLYRGCKPYCVLLTVRSHPRRLLFSLSINYISSPWVFLWL